MKAERDFKLVCTGGPYGDCCCSYAVQRRVVIDGLLDRNIKARWRTGQRRRVFVKRLVSRVIARRIVAEIELQGGRKPPLEGTRRLVEAQSWQTIARVAADCFVVRPLRRWMKRRNEK